MTKHSAAAALTDQALDSAALLFRQQGFAATTLRQVADHAGLHLGSLHYRWPTREALLAALMGRAIERATNAVRAAMLTNGSPGKGKAALAERLRLGLRAHLSLLLSGDASFHVLLYDWRSLEGDARAALLQQRSRYEAFWDGLLREAVDAGLARPGIDAILVRQFGFGAMNWVTQWYQPGRAGQPDAGAIADAFWDYLAFGLLSEAGKKLLSPARTRTPKSRARPRPPTPIGLARRPAPKRGR